MNRFTLVAALSTALIAGPVLATPDGWSPLLEPAQLNALLAEHGEDIRVIQISGDYAQGHIPGAGWSPYSAWRSPAPNPGALRDLPHLTGVVQELGIDAGTPVVVVHAGTDATDMGAAARVYWTLRSLGVQDLALLNGGLAAWTAAGLPVETADASFFPSDFQPEWSNAWRATTEEVAALVDSGEATLIDARPAGFFEGLTWSAAAPGTIRTAGNLEYTDFFDGTRFVGTEDIRRIAAENGYSGEVTTVSFCNTGHWAAINWFALSEVAGYDDVRLYAESMAEYANGERPLDHAPNRLQYAWRASTRWIADLF